MPAPKTYNTELKGGGFRGGPKRWTGNGPRPARHIPWPEVFKHHLSVVEGHLKMLDMIRKHTEPDSPNYHTVNEMVERCHEILAMTKKSSRDFVIPRNQRDEVPIGSSSASMYPGYSPADHVYGKAAQEYGSAAAKARDSGVEFEPRPGAPEYQIGQAKGAGKKKRLFVEPESTNTSNDKKDTSSAEFENGPIENEANQYFIVDSFPSKPTDSGPEKHNKKAKTNHNGALSSPEPEVELEDISNKVDKRMEEKEAKRKAKKEKKRKRVSMEGLGGETNAQATKAEAGVTDKPGRKKSKSSKIKDGLLKEKTIDQKRRITADEKGDEGSRRKRPKQSNSKNDNSVL